MLKNWRLEGALTTPSHTHLAVKHAAVLSVISALVEWKVAQMVSGFGNCFPVCITRMRFVALWVNSLIY